MVFIKAVMDLVRFLLTATRPFSLSLLDAIYRIFLGPKFVLPPIEDKILLMSASELAEKIRKKQLTAETVMKAFIKRIQEVEPLVNACVDQRFSEAMQEAREVDKLLANTFLSVDEIAKTMPLLGVPFSCKESVGVKGMAQTNGVYEDRHRKAEQDSDTASLYRKAGAIPVVATNVPEFCTWWEANNVIFGRTYNPYDNTRCTGGSSGGEAAILAYAGSVIGIGNDLAGSIRVPSCFNGIYGLKCSPGAISNRGVWPSDDETVNSLISTGPMCRYARDLPLLSNILSENRIRFDKKVDFRTLKIYYMEQFPGYLLNPIPDVKAAVRKAARHFEDTYDNKPSKISIKELKYALEIWESKLVQAGIPPIRDEMAEQDETINLFFEFVKSIFRFSEHTLPAIYYAVIERQKKDADYHMFVDMFDSLKKKMDEILKDDAILLIPTHPEPAVHHFVTIPKYPNQAYTCIMNVLGYPATQIPAGLSKGLPIGIQAVSATNCDNLTVMTAVELDKVFAGWKSPSEIAT